MSDEGKTNGGEDWRTMRREQRDARRAARGNWHGGPWVGGLLLVGLGLVFLLRNFGYSLPQHWWSLFLLLPGLAALASAWSISRQNGGQFTGAARGALIGGLILVALAFLFFFDVDMAKFWPVILIVIGVSLLAGGFARR